jgi:hypothetical protein
MLVCAWEKSAVQRDIAGLTKVLPAPERATLLFVLDELQALRAPRAATATAAVHTRFDMKRSSSGVADRYPTELYTISFYCLLQTREWEIWRRVVQGGPSY